jgi:hypothetical protein
MRQAARCDAVSRWVAYGAAGAIFVALAFYILALRPGRDVRVCVWLFFVTYPGVTIPVLIAYLRVCDWRAGCEEFAAASHRHRCRVASMALIIGLLPGVLLAGGHFIFLVPVQPAELPVFLALLATVVMYAVFARHLSRVPARNHNRQLSDATDYATGEMRARVVRRDALSQRFKWPYLALVAAMMFVALIPYSPA